MGNSASRALVLSVLVLALVPDHANGQAGAGVRRPRGIYAVVIIAEHIAAQRAINPSITDAGLHTYFNNLYSSLLNNPAASGLAIEVKWDMLNPGSPSSAQPYDWSWLDDGFTSAGAWNSSHPAAPPKTIQITISPGFNTPSWVTDPIPSCDGLFQFPVQTPPGNCGKATFLGYVEGGGGVLPLPWNPAYKNAWLTFLTAFAARYQANPALVSVDVAGPSAASTETLMPDNANTPSQSQFGDILPNEMWLKLLAFAYPGQPAYQKSDQALIDEWNAAIDAIGKIFNGVTLVLWAEPGLPNLSATGYTVPAAFKDACPTVNMDCAAVTTILSHFVDPTVGGGNAKGVSQAGMTGIAFVGDLGPASAKALAESTAALTSPSAQILAGQQFAHTVANYPLQEGCTSVFPPDAADKPAGCNIPSTCTVTTFQTACLPVACIPPACLAPGFTAAGLASFKTFGNVPRVDLLSVEQGTYNVLRKYYDGTPAASFFGGTPGAAPLNYLQIYSEDFQYAAAHSNAPATIVQTSGATVTMSEQDLLNLASQKLLALTEPPPAITSVANAGGESPVIAPNTWVEIKGQNLAAVGFDRIWGGADFVNGKMPTAINGVSATVNGKSAYVYYASPTQVNILTAPDAMSGPVQVQVTTNGASAGFTDQASAVSPSFFVFDGGPYVAATHADGTLLGPPTLYPSATTPAQPGETIVLYANGFGQTSSPVTSGSAAQSGILLMLPVITIGGAAAPVSFAGLVAPGEFQFNVVVPPTLGNGDQPITATYNGASTQSGALITVHN